MAVLLNLLGMVALLLWGVRLVRTGMIRAYGTSLRHALEAATKNRFAAAGGGMMVTAILQSSTATGLILSSFVSQGLMPVAPALAVMLGADVGSAVVAQILSFDLGGLMPLALLVGFIVFTMGQRTRARDLGRVAVGLGLMLLAIQQMVQVTGPLQDSETVMRILTALGDEPLLALFVAAALTWLAHSSLAVVLLLASMTTSGMLGTDLAFTLVLGANLGAAAPLIVATVGQDPVSRRVAIGNGVFRVVGSFTALALLPYYRDHIAFFGEDPARQAVHLHMLFNFTLLVLFIGLIGPVAALCAKILPDNATEENDLKPKYLDTSALATPSVALALASREILRIGDIVEEMLIKTYEVFRTDDRDLVFKVEAMDDQLDRIYDSIKLYCTQISRKEMTEAEGQRCGEIIAFNTNLEHVGDIIDKNLMELASKKIRHQLSFSKEGWAELELFHKQVLHNLKLAMSVFMSDDIDMARMLFEAKEQFREQEMKLSDSHFERLRSEQKHTLETSALHLDILRDLKRVNSHLASVAYPILDAAGALRSSRLRRAPIEEPAK